MEPPSNSRRDTRDIPASEKPPPLLPRWPLYERVKAWFNRPWL